MTDAVINAASFEGNAQLTAARRRIITADGEPLGRPGLAARVVAYLHRTRNKTYPFTPNYLGKLERGEIRWPQAHYREALRAVLGVPDDRDLGFYAPHVAIVVVSRSAQASHLDASTTDLDELRRRTATALTSSALSNASMDDWLCLVSDYGHASRTRAAPELLADLTSDFEELTQQLERPHPSRTLRHLTRVAAQMSGLIFLTLIKLEQRQAARTWSRTARIAADEADDPVLKCWVRAQEAYVHFYCGRMDDALRVAQGAQTLGGSQPSVGLCLAAALEARVHGMLGNDSAARACIERAETSLVRLPAEDLVPSAFGYNEAQLRFHEGNALTALRDTNGARRAHSEALNLYPTADYLDRALVQLDQAHCLVHEHDTPAAVAASLRAIQPLTLAQRRGLAHSRGLEIFALLPASEQRTRNGRELYSTLTVI